MDATPRRLRNEPLIEAIWQVQFDSPGAGDALPGVLYSALRGQSPSIQLHRLPAADIPPSVSSVDPILRLAAKFRLEAPDNPFLWQVGEKIAALNCRRPYTGWEQMKTKILELIRIIEGSGLVAQPSQHSLRYIDLLTLNRPPDLSALQLAMNLGGLALSKVPLRLRLEQEYENCLHVVQVATPSRVWLGGVESHGTVVDIETFPTEAPAGWDQVRSHLDVMHESAKRLFFRHVLTEKAIQELEPEY